MLRSVLCVAALLAGLWSPRGVAAASDIEIVDVAVGFNSRLKIGRETPLLVTLRGPAGATVRPAIEAPDPDGSLTTWPLSEVTLKGEEPVECRGVFRVGRIAGVLRVTAGGSSRALPMSPPSRSSGPESCRSYRQSVLFIGMLGPAEGFAKAFGASDAESDSRDRSDIATQLILFEDPSSLPDMVEAYDALDIMVVSKSFDLDAPRNSALAAWVGRGGHLIVHPGSNPDDYLGSSIAEWAPLELLPTPAHFREVAVLMKRVLGAAPPVGFRSVPGVRVRQGDGEVLAGSLDGPLLLRTAYGLGRITCCAVDWTQPPLVAWGGLPGLCQYLAEVEPAYSEEETNSSSQLRPTGVSELMTQLSGQLDHFPQVRRPSYWVVICLLAALMLVIGPLDYLLVHRLLRKPRLTWLTLPVWIAAAAFAGNRIADSVNPQTRLSNQLDLVTIDGATGLTESESWMTMYSPRHRRYAVQAEGAEWIAGRPASAEQVARDRISWSGSPETGFRGMYRQGGLDLGNPAYQLSPEGDAIENLPIGQWSTRSLSSAESQLRAGDHKLVESTLRDDGTHRLLGTITHHLPRPLTDWCLAYHKTAYIPQAATTVGETASSIAPGRPFDPERGDVRSRMLGRFLTGVTFSYKPGTSHLKSEAVANRQDYDPLGLDPLVWARALTFHEAIGARQYTTLANDVLSREDLSRLLNLHRAVLFGRMEAAATKYTIDGEPASPESRSTFVRFVLPVQPAEHAAAAEGHSP